MADPRQTKIHPNTPGWQTMHPNQEAVPAGSAPVNATGRAQRYPYLRQPAVARRKSIPVFVWLVTERLRLSLVRQPEPSRLDSN